MSATRYIGTQPFLGYQVLPDGPVADDSLCAALASPGKLQLFDFVVVGGSTQLATIGDLSIDLSVGPNAACGGSDDNRDEVLYCFLAVSSASRLSFSGTMTGAGSIAVDFWRGTPGHGPASYQYWRLLLEPAPGNPCTPQSGGTVTTGGDDIIVTPCCPVLLIFGLHPTPPGASPAPAATMHIDVTIEPVSP